MRSALLVRARSREFGVGRTVLEALLVLVSSFIPIANIRFIPSSHGR